jgi:hypothetical protein
LIAAQLAGRRPVISACDVVLATAVAVQAAGQVLAFIDAGSSAPTVINGTLELVMPDWRWRRRTWPLHQECACSRRDFG